jgi:hypothetical protein
MSDNDDFVFENMPYKPLPIPIARSKLLLAISEELTAQSRKNEGKRVMQLSDLGTCPDQELKLIIPTILPKSKISIKDGFVCGASSMTGKSYRLFAQESAALTVFNMFNGINTIDTISKTLAQEAGWAEERSFAYTRGVFLSLVMAGLCMPKE